MKFSDKFICSTTEYSTIEKSVAAPYFRFSFENGDPLSDAEITVSAAGFYEIYINGQNITKGILAPYISNTNDVIYYDNYNLIQYIKPGKNVIAFVLGNGFQNSVGGYVWNFDLASFRSSPKLAFALEAKTKTGRNIIFEADENVKTAPSPIVFDDLRCGEHYDARLEIPGWNECGFDDSSWKNALPCKSPAGKKVLCGAEPVVITKETSPKSFEKTFDTCVYKFKNNDQPVQTNCFYNPEEDNKLGGYLYDFGANGAGLIRLKIKNTLPGQRIILQFCEKLKDGHADYSNTQFYPAGFAQRDIYICKGAPEEVYIPRFTYHGYRYCEILGVSDSQATDDLLTYLHANSDLSERGSFVCSDSVANTLQNCARASDLSNFYYFPTDCPQREKNGWTGDANASAEHMTLNLSVEKSYREWLVSIRASQKKDGSLPGIVPTTGWGFAWGNGPFYDGVLFTLPFVNYVYRGDIETISENAYAMLLYLKYLSGKRTKRGLVDFGLGDWVPTGRRCDDIPSPIEVTQTAASYNICRKAYIMFSAAGLSSNAAFAEKLGNELRESFRKYLIDYSDMTVLGSTQTCQALALHFGLFDESEKPAAFSRLLDLIKDKDDHFDCGFAGLRCIFHVLSDFGEADLAYKMITRKDFPSYGEWVERGDLTTLYESFHNKNISCGSFNHHFLGDISGWFIKAILGIRINPFFEDANEVYIKPNFITSLNFAQGHYDSVCGKISVKWERNGEKINLSVSAPEKAYGKIIAPRKYKFDNDYSCIPLASGHYTLVKSDVLIDSDENVY